MIYALTLLFAAQRPNPEILEPLLFLPIPKMVQVAPAEHWSIRSVRVHRRPWSENGRLDVRVGGKTVSLKADDPDSPIYFKGRGSDGSILFARGNNNQFVWYKGSEHRLAYQGADVYRDRMNYAGGFGDDNGPIMPVRAPYAFVVRNGVYQNLVWGSVVAWDGGDELVIEVPVDDRLNPSGPEFTLGKLTRVHGGPQGYSLAGYRYLSRAPNGTLAFTNPAGDDGDTTQYGCLTKQDPSREMLLQVRSGKVASHLALPKSWTAIAQSPAGWFLVRRIKLVPEPLDSTTEATLKRIDPGTVIIKQMATEEEDWSMGILIGDRITPISFRRPRGTKQLLWRTGEGNDVLTRDSIRFNVFLGNEERSYVLKRIPSHQGRGG